MKKTKDMNMNLSRMRWDFCTAAPPIIVRETWFINSKFNKVPNILFILKLKDRSQRLTLQLYSYRDLPTKQLILRLSDKNLMLLVRLSATIWRQTRKTSSISVFNSSSMQTILINQSLWSIGIRDAPRAKEYGHMILLKFKFKLWTVHTMG